MDRSQDSPPAARSQSEPSGRVNDIRTGVIYGVAAFAAWGVAPVYFKAVATVSPLEVLAHRVVWSVVLLSALTLIRGTWRHVWTALKAGRTVLLLCATTVLIAANWLVFIWAIANNHVLQASLGYFINPLVNVLLGVIFLRERLSRQAVLSVFLASIGVAYMALQGGGLPLVAIALALTFAFYGLLRKVARVESVAGLTLETTLLGPVALGYLIWLGAEGSGHFGTVSREMTILLACAGPITALPLIWFTKGARRLRYSTIGFLQYIAPSLQFLLAVFAFGEAFTYHHMITFGFIWTALTIYSIDAARQARTSS